MVNTSIKYNETYPVMLNFYYKINNSAEVYFTPTSTFTLKLNQNNTLKFYVGCDSKKGNTDDIITTASFVSIKPI